MERVNSEIRDREKTTRGLNQKRTIILQGYQIYHDYIRPHETLDDKTQWARQRVGCCGIGSLSVQLLKGKPSLFLVGNA